MPTSASGPGTKKSGRLTVWPGSMVKLFQEVKNDESLTSTELTVICPEPALNKEKFTAVVSPRAVDGNFSDELSAWISPNTAGRPWPSTDTVSAGRFGSLEFIDSVPVYGTAEFGPKENATSWVSPGAIEKFPGDALKE